MTTFTFYLFTGEGRLVEALCTLFQVQTSTWEAPPIYLNTA